MRSRISLLLARIDFILLAAILSALSGTKAFSDGSGRDPESTGAPARSLESSPGNSTEECELLLVAPKWTQEAVIDILRLLNNQGIDLSVSSIRRENSERVVQMIRQHLHFIATSQALYKAARRYFGTWDGAVTAAGFDASQSRKLTKWSRETIIAIIQDMQNAGLELHNFAVRNNKGDEIKTIFFKHLGRDLTGKDLAAAVSRSFPEGWDGALTAAGIDPTSVHTQARWSKDLVVAAIQILHEADVPLASKWISRDTSEKTSELIKEVVHVTASGPALHDRGVAYFGNWDGALTAAGIDPASVRLRSPTMRWTRSLVIEVIQALHAESLALNRDAVETNTSAPFREVVKKVTGLQVGGYGVVGAGVRHFGSWEEALQAAGFDPSTIVHENVQWTQALVLNFLARMRAAHFRLNLKAVEENEAEDFLDLVEEVFGARLNGSSVVNGVTRVMGSWDNALRAAGMNPLEIRPQVSWTEERILRLLAELRSQGVELRQVVLKQADARTLDIIRGFLGQQASGAAVVHAAIAHFGSWNEALARLDGEVKRPPLLRRFAQLLLDLSPKGGNTTMNQQQAERMALTRRTQLDVMPLEAFHFMVHFWEFSETSMTETNEELQRFMEVMIPAFSFVYEMHQQGLLKGFPRREKMKQLMEALLPHASLVRKGPFTLNEDISLQTNPLRALISYTESFLPRRQRRR